MRKCLKKQLVRTLKHLMISLTIDPSIFILPPKIENVETEYQNIKIFLSNINIIRVLERYPSITISYINKLKYFLKKSNCFPDNDELYERINLLRRNNCTFELSIEETLNYYIEDLSKSLSKQNNEKSGIYKNIPDIDVDKEEKYKNIIYNRSVYPYEYKEYYILKGIFKKYLGFIAELNYNYSSEKSNYIVISGDKKHKQEVIMKFNGNNKVNVNIIGIQKIKEEIHERKCSDIKKELPNIKELHSKNIIYGNGIIDENFPKYINDDISTKLYYYLNTLNDITKIINEKNINDEKILMFLINAHGCLCSPDDEIYKKCCFDYRHFTNDIGEKEYFTLHLKPITETINKANTYTLGGEEYNSTIRIYLKLKNQKILIGWMGKHPKTCFDCDKKCSK